MTSDQPIETLLDQKYDHVLDFNEQEMELSQLARLDDYSTGQRICINRNLHNGDTKHIKIKAKAKENQKIYIAGDESP